MELELGDIIGYKPKTTASWLAALIKLGGKQRYSHVMIYVGGNRVIEATPKGIKVDDLWVNPNDKENVRVMRIKGGLTGEQKERLVTLAYGYQGVPYDLWHYPFLFLYSWFGNVPIIRKVLKWVAKVNDKEFMNCSEFVSRVYWEALGIDLGDEESHDFTLPDDIMDSPLLEDI